MKGKWAGDHSRYGIEGQGQLHTRKYPQTILQSTRAKQYVELNIKQAEPPEGGQSVLMERIQKGVIDKPAPGPGLTCLGRKPAIPAPAPESA